MKRIRHVLWWLAICLCLPALPTAAKTGTLGNLVCFVRFADEGEEGLFEHTLSYYDLMFNNTTAGANSVYNYFHEASYGQLQWKSTFYPTSGTNQVTSIQVALERGYYREKGTINTIGYADEVEKAAREQALVREIAATLTSQLDDATVLDADNDGIIDNLCIILSGRSELSARHLLWPHRSDLMLPDEKAIYIRGKKLTGYLMVFDDANGWASLEPIPLNTGVLCHEMSHSLNTYDLYHTNDNLNPIGVWDLMSDNLTTPQHMSAYTKWKYCGWIDEIPEITAPGRYTLNPVGGPTAQDIAYKIKPLGSEEYFIVEYRRQAGTFDSGLPGEGLLVYRANPAFTGGNASYNGTTRLDELYIFRPGGTTTADGQVSQATLSAESGRTAIGGNASLKPFYSDGSEARFAIANVSACGETLSFDLLEVPHSIYAPSQAVVLSGTQQARMECTIQSDVPWSIQGLPAWLQATPAQGAAGTTTLVLQALSDNGSAKNREATLTLTGTDEPEVQAQLHVVQLSALVQVPESLQAVSGPEGVVLSWQAPQEGNVLIEEGFEDVSNPNGWTVSNAGDRGWTWMASAKNYLPYSGNYSMYMKSAWEDLHQDERLVSPVFSGGRTLSFYSKSIAPQKNISKQYYYVEVSSDGGQTWNVAYDLVKDCEVVNQYVKVTIDLAPYTSEQMQVAFHAYDETDLGLSYWWQIDDITIHAQAQDAMVQGYAVYRDGVLIANTTTCTYTDATATAGEHTYTVRATGLFGETSDSKPVTIQVGGTGIQANTAVQPLQAWTAAGSLHVAASRPLGRLTVFTPGGKTLYSLHTHAAQATLPLTATRGLYLVHADFDGQAQPASTKVILCR